MALPPKFEANIRKFQAKNNLPVHLKGGPSDRVLFGITIALCGIGLIGSGEMLYSMAYKKK